MSQAKVDKYKEYKKNRKEIIAQEKKKEKKSKLAGWAVISVFVLFLLAATGYKVYDAYQERLAAIPNYEIESYILTDMASVLADETEEAAE